MKYDAHEMEDSNAETNTDQKNNVQRGAKWTPQNELIMKVEGLSSECKELSTKLWIPYDTAGLVKKKAKRVANENELKVL